MEQWQPNLWSYQSIVIVFYVRMRCNLRAEISLHIATKRSFFVAIWEISARRVNALLIISIFSSTFYKTSHQKFTPLIKISLSTMIYLSSDPETNYEFISISRHFLVFSEMRRILSWEEHWKTSLEKNPVFLRGRVRWISVWSTKVDMVCFSPVGYGV